MPEISSVVIDPNSEGATITFTLASATNIDIATYTVFSNSSNFQNQSCPSNATTCHIANLLVNQEYCVELMAEGSKCGVKGVASNSVCFSTGCPAGGAGHWQSGGLAVSKTKSVNPSHTSQVNALNKGLKTAAL